MLLPKRVEARASCQRHPSQPGSTKALVAVHRRMTTRICPPQGGAAGADRFRGFVLRGLAIDGGCLRDHPAEGGGRAGPAGMQQAVGQDMREEPAETLQSVEARGAWTCMVGCAGGEGNGAIRERDDTARGDRPCEDVRGEVCQGGVGVWRGLAVAVPGGRSALWGALLQQAGLAHVFFPQGAGEGGEGFDGDKEGGSGRQPTTTVLRQSTAGDNVGKVGVVREVPAPGMQDTGATRERCSDAMRVCGKPCEGERRGLEQGLGGEALSERRKGRRGAGTVQGMRQGGPGSCLSRGGGNHCGVVCCGHWGQWRLP